MDEKLDAISSMLRLLQKTAHELRFDRGDKKITHFCRLQFRN